jgi:sugar phosphate isomerase/epimerase
MQELERRIAELRARLPKHSAPAAMMVELDELEDSLRRLQGQPTGPDEGTRGRPTGGETGDARQARIPEHTGGEDMSKIPIALQLYSVRHDCEKDLRATLEAVAKMGYDGVEFAGYYGCSAQELRTMLADLGLKVAGAHISLDTLLGQNLPATMEFNHTLGNRFLIVPGLPKERTASHEAWLETARIFNEIAARLAPEGMVTGYHNHFTEFAPMGGEKPWDTLFRNTRKEVVMQLDTGNALHGGADPIPFLEEYPGRAVTVHLKEYSAGYDRALIGEGVVRWNDFFRLCETTGETQWYIVEQESYAFPPLECVKRCVETLRGWGK